MNDDRGAVAGTWLVVSLKSDDEQVAQIVNILREFEIPAVVSPRAPVLDPLAGITLKIPSDRVVAAVLVLEQHGFTHVRAYAGPRIDA